MKRFFFSLVSWRVNQRGLIVTKYFPKQNVPMCTSLYQSGMNFLGGTQKRGSRSWWNCAPPFLNRIWESKKRKLLLALARFSCTNILNLNASFPFARYRKQSRDKSCLPLCTSAFACYCTCSHVLLCAISIFKSQQRGLEIEWNIISSESNLRLMKRGPFADQMRLMWHTGDRYYSTLVTHASDQNTYCNRFHAYIQHTGTWQVTRNIISLNQRLL